MTPSTIYVTLAFLACAIVIGLGTTRTKARVTLLLTFLTLALGTGALLMASSNLGAPKSALTEAASPKSAEVLWAAPSRDKTLLLLTWDGHPEPTYYWFPSSQASSRSLRKAQEEAAARHGRLMIRNPFAWLRNPHPGPRTPAAGGGDDENEDGEGSEGHGAGGPKTGDNQGAEAGAFFAAPPAALPEKSGVER